MHPFCSIMFILALSLTDGAGYWTLFALSALLHVCLSVCDFAVARMLDGSIVWCMLIRLFRLTAQLPTAN